MSMEHRITDATRAREFVMAGNAHFTLRSLETGTRYTYRVRASEDASVFFVSVMYGPDNSGDYVYMGIFRRDQFAFFQTTSKSKVSPVDRRLQAFRWAWARIATGRLPDNLEFWHEGKCGRCGRRLTVPESIESGIGPECARRMEAA